MERKSVRKDKLVEGEDEATFLSNITARIQSKPKQPKQSPPPLDDLSDQTSWPTLTPNAPISNSTAPTWNIIAPAVAVKSTDEVDKIAIVAPQITFPFVRFKRPLRLLYQDHESEIEPIPSLSQIAAVHVAIYISTNQYKNWRKKLTLDLQELVLNFTMRYGIPTFDSIGYYVLDPKIKKFDLSIWNYNPLIQSKHLTRIFSTCIQLEELNLDDCYSFDDGAFLGLASSKMQSTLKKLSLCFCSKLTDKSVKIMLFSNMFKNLEELCLDGCNFIEGKWARPTERNVNNKLTSLSMNQCYGFNYKYWSDLGTCFPKLEKLSVKKVFRTREHSTVFGAFIESLPKTLTHLNLFGSSLGIPYESFARIMVQIAPRLVFLELGRTSNIENHQFEEVIRNAPNLEHLSISGRKKRGYGYNGTTNIFSHCKKLHTLKLPYANIPIRADDFPQLKVYHGNRDDTLLLQLEEYSGGRNYNPTATAPFPELPNMKTLQYSSAVWDTNTRKWVGMPILERCPNLEDYTGDIVIDDVDNEKFNFKQLKSIKFEPKVLNRGFQMTHLVSHFSYHLTQFIVKQHYEPMSAKTIALLKLNCPFLTVLKCNVVYTQQALTEAFTFERLKELRLGSFDRQTNAEPVTNIVVKCHLKKLRLHGKFTNEFIDCVTKQMPGLQFLNIQGTDTTFEVLKYIGANCPVLWKLTPQYLDLSEYCNYEHSRNGPHHVEHNYKHYLANRNWAKILVKMPASYFANLRKFHIYHDDAEIIRDKFLGKYPHVALKTKSGGYISGGGKDD